MEKTLVAIGDLHGDIGALMILLTHMHKNGILKTCDLEPDKGRYSVRVHSGFGFITLGDYIDRGDHSRQVLDCVMQIKGAIPLLGNHEMLGMAGGHYAAELLKRQDYRIESYQCHPHGKNGGDMFVGEFGNNVKEQLENFSREISRHGKYGKWLRERPPFTVQEVAGRKVAFVHAGVPGSIESCEDLDKFEIAYQKHMEPVTGEPREKFLYNNLVGENSPFWVRREFYGKPPELLKQHLEKLGLAAVVIGHTMSRDGKIRNYHNLVFDIDVAMSHAYSGNDPVYLIMDREGVHAQYCSKSDRETLHIWPPRFTSQVTIDKHKKDVLETDPESPSDKGLSSFIPPDHTKSAGLLDRLALASGKNSSEPTDEHPASDMSSIDKTSKLPGNVEVTALLEQHAPLLEAPHVVLSPGSLFQHSRPSILEKSAREDPYVSSDAQDHAVILTSSVKHSKGDESQAEPLVLPHDGNGNRKDTSDTTYGWLGLPKESLHSGGSYSLGMSRDDTISRRRRNPIGTFENSHDAPRCGYCHCVMVGLGNNSFCTNCGEGGI